jgi:hypothetical protein
MRLEDIWDREAAQGYDTPGTGMFAPDVLGPTAPPRQRRTSPFTGFRR